MFIVQKAANADRGSIHETREEAIAAIKELFDAGLAERGEFAVAELGADGRTTHVFSVDDEIEQTKTTVA